MLFRSVKITDMVQQIFLATREQETGVRQTTTAMAELNHATMRNSAMAQENAALSEQVRGQGERLERIEREMSLVVIGREEESNGSAEQGVVEAGEGAEIMNDRKTATAG